MNSMFSVNSSIVTATLLVLVFLSIVTWSIALLKFWRGQQDNRRNRFFKAAFWAARDWQEAVTVTEHGEGELAQLGRVGFAEIKNMCSEQPDLKHLGLKHLGAPQEVLEGLLKQHLQNVQRYHERGLAELATIGSTAPFIGLFGTVWGIMNALQDIGRSGTASLDIVAGPIGEALVATAIGIATALPAVLAYNFFLRRLRVKITELESFAHDFVRLALKHNFKL